MPWVGKLLAQLLSRCDRLFTHYVDGQRPWAPQLIPHYHCLMIDGTAQIARPSSSLNSSGSRSSNSRACAPTHALMINSIGTRKNGNSEMIVFVSEQLTHQLIEPDNFRKFNIEIAATKGAATRIAKPASEM